MCGIIALAKTHGTQNFFFLTVYAEKSFEKLIRSHMQWQNIVWGCSQGNKKSTKCNLQCAWRFKKGDKNEIHKRDPTRQSHQNHNHT